MGNLWGNQNDRPFDRANFLALLNNFGTLKRFTCFFESANFLMTDYHLLDNHVHAVFENQCGDTLQFQDLLCGYNGTGTENTIQALSCLGIDVNSAKQWCTSHDIKGFQLEFTPSSGINKYQEYSAVFRNWFYSFEDIGLFRWIHLGKCAFCSVVDRTIVFSLFQKNTLPTLFRCVQLMIPFSFEYSLNKHIPVQTYSELYDAGLVSRYTSNPLERCDPNLFIRGERFSIYCCIPEKALLGTLNALYFSLTGNLLFYEQKHGALSFFSNKPSSTGLLDILKQRFISRANDGAICRLPIYSESFYSQGGAAH